MEGPGEVLLTGLVIPIYPLLFWIIHRLGQLEGSMGKHFEDL